MTTAMPGMSPAAAASRARRRPTAVTILASIQILSALLLGLLALVLLLDPDTPLSDLEIPWAGAGGATLVLEAGTVAVAVALLAGLEMLAAVALMRLHRLGWTLTMLLAGFSLASQIVTWWSTSEILAVSMLLNVVTVLYLNQRQVRAAFDLADGRTADLEEDRG